MLFLAGLTIIISANPMMVLTSLMALAFIRVGAFTSSFRTMMAAFISLQWPQVTTLIWLAEFYRIGLSQPLATMICAICRPLHSAFVTSSTEEITILALAGIAMLAVRTRVLEPWLLWFRPSVDGLQPSRLF
jgi:hypothetical protein